MSTVDTTAANAAGEMSRYAFDNADAQGQNQLSILAAICDEHSVDVPSALGVGRGWQCLDVGPAPAPSAPGWPSKSAPTAMSPPWTKSPGTCAPTTQ